MIRGGRKGRMQETEGEGREEGCEEEGRIDREGKGWKYGACGRK